MSEKSFPRVLVLSSSVFNQRTGGGITLSNLFRGWPEGRIAAAHSDNESPTKDICTRYYLLGDAELGREGFFDIIERGPQDRGTVSVQLADWINRFAPDIIYTLLGSLGYVRLARELSTITRAPIVPHMMDDWPSVIYGKSFIGSILRRRLDGELRTLFGQAPARLAISPAMASEYAARYGREFESVSNPVDAEKWVRRPAEKDGHRTLLYVGSVLAEAQLDALADVAAAVDSLNERGGDIRFVIASPNYADFEVEIRLKQFRSVRLAGVPGEDGIADVVGSADLLLLPANFTPSSITYLRLSNPTKIPAYMASGVPILVYAPRQLDMVQRAERDGWGIVVGIQNRSELEKGISHGMSDESLRESVTGKAAQTFARDHDGPRVREQFREILARAATRGGA